MCTHQLGKETGDCRKARGSASWPHSSAVAPRLSLWLWGLRLASAAPCENNRFGTCPAGSEQSRDTEQTPGPPPSQRGRVSSGGVPMTPTKRGAPELCSPSVFSASLSWSTIHDPCAPPPPPTSFSTFLQNRNYFAHFLSKSKNRKEKGTDNLVQLLVLLLNKDFFFFYSHSVSGFPSHLHNLLLPFSSDAPFCKSHPLENPENVSASASLKLSTQLKGLLLRRSEPPTQGFLPLAMRTFSLDHWLVSVSFGTSHPR